MLFVCSFSPYCVLWSVCIYVMVWWYILNVIYILRLVYFVMFVLFFSFYFFAVVLFWFTCFWFCVINGWNFNLTFRFLSTVFLQTCRPAILPPLKEIYPGNVADDLIGIYCSNFYELRGQHSLLDFFLLNLIKK